MYHFPKHILLIFHFLWHIALLLFHTISSSYVPCPMKVFDCYFSVFLVKLDDHAQVTPSVHVQWLLFAREQHCAFLSQATVVDYNIMYKSH